MLSRALNQEQKSFVEDLVSASVCDIVPTKNVASLIEKGIMKKKHEYDEIVELSTNILAHFCSPRCLRRVSDGDGPDAFVCRKPNNLKLSPDNTKHCFLKLPMNLTSECKNILEDIKLKEVQEFNEFGFEKKTTYNHDILIQTVIFRQQILLMI